LISFPADGPEINQFRFFMHRILRSVLATDRSASIQQMCRHFAFRRRTTLMLRVANQRHIAMADAEFRVMLFRNEPTLEEPSVRRFYPLKLQFDRMISFPVALTLRHVIDRTQSKKLLTVRTELVQSGAR
jgi:hypothetical protein